MSTLKVEEIQHLSNSNNAVSIASDSSVSLKHSGSAKLATTATGVSVTGTCAATAFSGDGSALTNLPSTTDATKMPLAGGTFTGSVAFAGLLQESFHNDTTATSGTVYHDVLTYGMVYHSSANAGGVINFALRGDATTTFDSISTVGKTTTFTVFSPSNNASYYISAFIIDGSVQNVIWAGASGPAAATGSGVDVYSYTILKTAANTYSVFGNFTNFG